MIHRFTAAGICLLCLTACKERGGKPAATGQRTAEAASRVNDQPDARKLADRLIARLREARIGEDLEKRDLRLVEIAWEAIELEPALAREVLAMISPGSVGLDPLAAHIAMRMAEEDADAVIVWANGLESPLRNAAISRISVVIAAEDPQRGATLVAEMLPPGRDDCFSNSFKQS